MIDILFVFLSLSLSGSILALILLAIKLFVKNRLSQTWQYYIWLVVILRFMLPFTPQVSIVGEITHQLQGFVSTPIVGEANQSFDANKDYTIPDVTYTPSLSETTQNAKPKTPLQTYDEIPARNEAYKPHIYWRDILDNIWLLWAGVALALFVHKVASYRSFVRFINAGKNKITDPIMLDIYADVLTAAKVKRQIPLYINEQVVSPMLVGVLQPALVLPVLETSDDELRQIFSHELTHFKRWDFLYKWLVQITLCLHWFNPLVYLINRQINKSCELSCDESVIKHLDEDSRVTYGDALMASLTAQGKYNNFVVSITMSENVNIVKERLDMIMSYKKKSRFVYCIATMLTVVMLCGFTFAGAYASPKNVLDPVAVNVSIDSIQIKDMTTMKTATIKGETWFLIETEPQLRSIGSEAYPLSAKYMLNADITLSKSEDWVPIGTFEKPFTGVFNGNGFEIINLTIKNPDVKIIGMFAYAQNATICNVTLRNPDIQSAFLKGDSIAPILVIGLGGNEYDNQVIEGKPNSQQIDSRLRQVTKEYTLAELKALNVSGIIVDVLSENIKIERGGDKLILEYLQMSDGEYVIDTQPDMGGTIEELSLRRTTPIDSSEPPRSVLVVIPDKADFIVTAISTDSGIIRINGCVSRTLNCKTKNGEITIIGGTVANLLLAKSETGQINISGIATGDNFSAFLESDGREVYFQPQDSVENYQLIIDTKPQARITVNGKDYAGGDFKFNENAAKKVYFDSGRDSSTFIVQDAPTSRWVSSLEVNFKKYEQFGVAYSSALDAVYYNGERVRLFVDFMRDKGENMDYAFDLCFQDRQKLGTLCLEAVEDNNGKVIGVRELDDTIASELLWDLADTPPVADARILTFDATLKMESYGLEARDLTKDKTPANIKTWMTECDKQQGTFVKEIKTDNGYITYIYCNQGGRYPWNMSMHDGKVFIYLFSDSGLATNDGYTLLYYTAPSRYDMRLYLDGMELKF